MPVETVIINMVLRSGTVRDLPAGMNEDTVWIVDQAIPRSKLGVGVMEFQTCLGVQSSSAAPTALEAPHAPLPTPGAAASIPDKSQAATEPPTKARRILETKMSDPEEMTFESIAVATKEVRMVKTFFLKAAYSCFSMISLQVFDGGRFYSVDSASPRFGEFWLRNFTKYAAKAAQSNQIPEYMKRYVLFCVKSLLQKLGSKNTLA